MTEVTGRAGPPRLSRKLRLFWGIAHISWRLINAVIIVFLLLRYQGFDAAGSWADTAMFLFPAARHSICLAALSKMTRMHTWAYWYTCWLVYLSLMIVCLFLFFLGLCGCGREKPWTCGIWLCLFLLSPVILEKDPICINHGLPSVLIVSWVSPPMIDAVVSVCRMDSKRWRMVKANASSVVRGKNHLPCFHNPLSPLGEGKLGLPRGCHSVHVWGKSTGWRRETLFVHSFCLDSPKSKDISFTFM